MALEVSGSFLSTSAPTWPTLMMSSSSRPPPSTERLRFSFDSQACRSEYCYIPQGQAIHKVFLFHSCTYHNSYCMMCFFGRHPLPFTAHLAHGSDPDITVSPTSGELAPVNSRGTLFFIAYKPRIYGRVHKARLIVNVRPDRRIDAFCAIAKSWFFLFLELYSRPLSPACPAALV